MTDALSDAIQGKPGPSSEVKAPFTTTDFGSTAKDVPVSDSHDLANGCAINPSDVEKPPTQTSPANGGTEVCHIVTSSIASLQPVSNRDFIITEKSLRTFRATDKV